MGPGIDMPQIDSPSQEDVERWHKARAGESASHHWKVGWVTDKNIYIYI